MGFYQLLRSEYGSNSLSDNDLLDYFVKKYSSVLGFFKPTYEQYIFDPIHVTDENILEKYGREFIIKMIEQCIIHRIYNENNEYLYGRLYDTMVAYTDGMRGRLYHEIFYLLPIKERRRFKKSLVVELIDKFTNHYAEFQTVDQTVFSLMKINRLMNSFVYDGDDRLVFSNLITADFNSSVFYNYLKNNELIDYSGKFIYYKDRTSTKPRDNTKSALCVAIATFYILNYFWPDLTDRSARAIFKKAAYNDFGVDISESSIRDAIKFLRDTPEAIDKSIPITFHYQVPPEPGAVYVI